MIQVWAINILVMPSRGRTEKSKNGQKHHKTKAPKDQNQGGQNPQKWEKYFKTPTIKVYDPMITWYRYGQSTFSSWHHVAAQRKAKMDKSTIRQKLPKDQNQGGQNPQKWEKYFTTPTIKVYDPMITWYRCGESTFSSCHHVAAQRKAKMDKSTTGQKPQRIRIKADKTPQKWENILKLQQSRCTISWSHDTGLDNQHSRHAITWPQREKQKWKKAPYYKSKKGSESRRTKPPKMRKYFKTPTIKVYDPMITWYRCGQSTFSSCHHVAAQRKAKMDKSTTGRKS